MSNNFSDYQKEMFYDLYKTFLGATISSTPDFFYGRCRKEDAIRGAVKLAKVSVKLLTDENGLRQPTDVQKKLSANWVKIVSDLHFL